MNSVAKHGVWGDSKSSLLWTRCTMCSAHAGLKLCLVLASRCCRKALKSAENSPILIIIFWSKTAETGEGHSVEKRSKPYRFSKKKFAKITNEKKIETLIKIVSMYAGSVRLLKILFFDVQRWPMVHWPWLTSQVVWLTLAFASFNEVCDHGEK